MAVDVVGSVVTATGSAQPLGRGAPRRGLARRLVATVPRPHTVVRDHDDAAAVLTRLYVAAVRGRGVVHVVQLTSPGARDLAADLAAAGWFVGDRPAYRDLTGDRTAAPAPVAGPTVLGLRTARIDGAAIRVLRHAATAVLVVDTAPGAEAMLSDAADLLAGLDVAVVGLVVHDGRIPAARR